MEKCLILTPTTALTTPTTALTTPTTALTLTPTTAPLPLDKEEPSKMMVITQLILLEPVMMLLEAWGTMEHKPGAILEVNGEITTVLPVRWEDMLENCLILTSVEVGQLLEITFKSTLAVPLIVLFLLKHMKT